MAFHLLFLSALLTLSSGDLFRVDPPCFAQAGALPFPKSYVVYHLAETEKIAVDGHLDETAWSGVPWTDRFIGKKRKIVKEEEMTPRDLRHSGQ